MGGLRLWVLWLVSALVATTGCHRKFKESVVQPNPLVEPNETLRVSEEVVIVTGDMELNVPRGASGSAGSIWVDERYPLKNKASFTVVSRDRLRFHLQIEHKWEEWADITNWDAVLIDDQGRRYDPEEIELRKDRHVVKMWDYEQRTAYKNRFGDVVYVANDGYKRRQPLASLSLFRGQGDVVFYSRDIFTPEVKALTLVISRSGTSFEFTWRFDGDPGAPAPRQGRRDGDIASR